MPSPVRDAIAVDPSGRPTASVGVRIELDGVSHTYGSGSSRRQALAGIHLDVPPGEFLCIVGPSGCGKSTLLRFVAGFAQPTSGSVRVGGTEVAGPGADRGMVFQQPRLFPWKSVRRNVELGPKFAGLPADERRERASRVLASVGLSDVADRLPHELSGGMQQRAAIARALAAQPAVLLMDEPFAALDALTRERLQEEIVRIWRETGTTIAFVTHSVDEAVAVGSRVVVMSAGPGRVVVDTPCPLAQVEDRDRLRSRPDFVELRDILHDAVRDVAPELT